MAKMSEQTEDKLFSKMIIVGESGSGKTGSLVSLVKAGYKLRILDMDNNLSFLRNEIKREDPALLEQVDYISLRDKVRSDPVKGAVVDGRPKAYTDAIKYMNKWDDGSKPSELGPEYIFVVDSLWAFGAAAFNWAKGMNPGTKDPRQWYGTAQESIRTVLGMLTSDDFKTNLIVITHTVIVERGEDDVRMFPASIGKSLGPDIPKFFSTMIMADGEGAGSRRKRFFRTVPTNIMELKNAAPFLIGEKVPLETGLIDIFESIKGKEAHDE